MNSTTKSSKNKRRKNRRQQFHAIINALSSRPDDPDLQEAMKALKEEYFSGLDQQLDNMGIVSERDPDRDERMFIRDVLKGVEHNGWVTVYKRDGSSFQMKANVREYIGDRQSTGPGNRIRQANKYRALAARHLWERAIFSIQPAHP